MRFKNGEITCISNYTGMYVLKIINKHILQTGMQLYLILSCDVYSIGHQIIFLR
jgi:hypothetical protein